MGLGWNELVKKLVFWVPSEVISPWAGRKRKGRSNPSFPSLVPLHGTCTTVVDTALRHQRAVMRGDVVSPHY